MSKDVVCPIHLVLYLSLYQSTNSLVAIVLILPLSSLLLLLFYFGFPPPSLSFPFFSFGNNFLNVFFIGNVMLASRMVRSSSFFIVSSLVCDFSSGCSVVGWICRFRSNTSFSFHTCNFSVSVFLLSLWVAFVAFWPPLRLQRSATSTAVDRRPLRWQ